MQWWRGRARTIRLIISKIIKEKFSAARRYISQASNSAGGGESWPGESWWWPRGPGAAGSWSSQGENWGLFSQQNAVHQPGAVLDSGCTIKLACQQGDDTKHVPLKLVRRCWGPRGAQSVKPPTLDFSSGHDLTIVGWSPTLGPALTVWSLLGILSLPLSLPLPSSLSLSK